MMFQEYPDVYVEKDTKLKNMGKTYYIAAGKRVIGTIQESQVTPKSRGDRIIKLIRSLFLGLTSSVSLESIEWDMYDQEEKVLGKVKKQGGLYRDFLLYSTSGRHLATIKSTVRVKSPAMTVYDTAGEALLEAKGTYGATDFVIYNIEKNEQISTIRKRSLIYPAIKDNFFRDDVYHIDNHNRSFLISFSLITLALAMDVHFHSK